MGLTSLALKLAAPLPHIEQYSRYLFIGPHPDDIEIGSGATAAKLAAMGKRVSFLICCDGRYGLEHAAPGTTPEQLIEIRKQEAYASAQRLGVTDIRFLELSDGGLYDPAELRRRMAVAVGQIKPELIFAPDPTVRSECHADHLNVGEAARRLAFFAPFAEIMARYDAESAPVQAVAWYFTARPSRYVRLSREQFTAQREAIRLHASQFPAGCDALHSVELYLKLRAADFGLRCFCSGAEGFRVLGQTQMHCLPEAGV